MHDDVPVQFTTQKAQYLCPFSAHRIEIWGEVFPTAEHAYQGARLIPSPERESIIHAASPLAAWQRAQEYKKNEELLNPNFDKDAVMEEIFRAKLTQHPEVREILLATGDRGLLKIHPHDYYWGTGADGSGENKMGKLWMKLRDEMSHDEK